MSNEIEPRSAPRRKIRWPTITRAAAWALLLGSSWALGASDEHHELAKEEQNPLARLVRVQLEDNAQLGFGPDNEVLNFFRIQPVVPFDLTEEWSLITRTVIPIVHLPFRNRKTD